MDITGLSRAITEREDGSILIAAATSNTAVAERGATKMDMLANTLYARSG